MFSRYINILIHQNVILLLAHRDMRKMMLLQKELEKGQIADTKAQETALSLGLSLVWKLGKLQVCVVSCGHYS